MQTPYLQSFVWINLSKIKPRQKFMVQNFIFKGSVMIFTLDLDMLFKVNTHLLSKSSVYMGYEQEMANGREYTLWTNISLNLVRYDLDLSPINNRLYSRSLHIFLPKELCAWSMSQTEPRGREYMIRTKIFHIILILP